MISSPDAYPEMIIAQARQRIRELDRQQHARRARTARRHHRLGWLLKWRG
jgi:hypothetical protein